MIKASLFVFLILSFSNIVSAQETTNAQINTIETEFYTLKQFTNIPLVNSNNLEDLKVYFKNIYLVISKAEVRKAF